MSDCKQLLRRVLSRLIAREELSGGEISEFIEGVNSGEISEVQIAGFLVGLTVKGATVKETAEIVKAMRRNSVPLKPRVAVELTDTCGTGGGLPTFNISTAAAVVAAAAGVPVAKHGSRSISSLSGSADVLEALGVEINLSQRSVEKMIEEIGLAFIYAPLYNPVMCKVLPPEAAMGIKTIFYSIIGPLINPAQARQHLLGVYQRELMDVAAQVAREVGFTHAMIVHGVDGVDEISPLGKTVIYELRNGDIEVYEVTPEDFGLARCTPDEIRSREPKINAEIMEGLFSRRVEGGIRDAVVLNAAGVIKVGGKAPTMKEGIALATELIDAGAAADKLRQLREMSHSFHDSSNA